MGSKKQKKPTQVAVEPQKAKKGAKQEPITEGTDDGGDNFLSKLSIINVRPNIVPVTLPNTLPLVFTQQHYQGPTDFSNWVIPGHLLCGAFPRARNIRSILDMGITTIICLVEKHELQQHGPNYIENAQSKLKDVQLNFLHFPIRDRDIAPDEPMIKLVNETIRLLQDGEIIYIHCVGGHGRTGVLVSLVLSKLYSLDSFKALEYCKVVHDLRGVTLGRDSPQTGDQRNQVHRLVPKL